MRGAPKRTRMAKRIGGARVSVRRRERRAGWMEVSWIAEVWVQKGRGAYDYSGAQGRV